MTARIGARGRAPRLDGCVGAGERRGAQGSAGASAARARHRSRGALTLPLRGGPSPKTTWERDGLAVARALSIVPASDSVRLAQGLGTRSSTHLRSRAPVRDAGHERGPYSSVPCFAG